MKKETTQLLCRLYEGIISVVARNKILGPQSSGIIIYSCFGNLQSKQVDLKKNQEAVSGF